MGNRWRGVEPHMYTMTCHNYSAIPIPTRESDSALTEAETNQCSPFPTSSSRYTFPDKGEVFTLNTSAIFGPKNLQAWTAVCVDRLQVAHQLTNERMLKICEHGHCTSTSWVPSSPLWAVIYQELTDVNKLVVGTLRNFSLWGRLTFYIAKTGDGSKEKHDRSKVPKKVKWKEK